MRGLGKKGKVERYAGRLERWETQINKRLRGLSERLRVVTDRYPARVKWIGLIVFMVGSIIASSIIIYNVFK